MPSAVNKESGLVLEKNLTVVSIVAFVVLQADALRPKPAITNQNNTFGTVHLCLMMGLLPGYIQMGAWISSDRLLLRLRTESVLPQVNEQQEYADDE